MFKNDSTMSTNNEHSQKLLGRYIKGSDNIIGKISDIEPKYNSCEVCINFSDGIRVLDTRYTINHWLENSFNRDQLSADDLKQFRKRVIINNKN